MPIWSFLFSNLRRFKWLRHVSFWILWLLFQLLLYSNSPSPLLMKQDFLTRLQLTLPESLVFMIPQLFLAYSLMYGVIEKLVIPGRYVKAIALTLLLVIATAALSALLSMTVVDWLRYRMNAPVSPALARQPDTPTSISFGVAMLAGLRGAVMVGGIASVLKLVKYMYEKQQAAQAAEKEKIHAELQMLKAQLHPHFLFNTLNNIYSMTQDVSAPASTMILRLSGLLRYILYTGTKEKVPLDGELQMIQDYVRLEALRYDESFDLVMDLPTNTGASIAPLLLLPFVENAFKHGASRMIERPWINLRIEVNDGTMSLVLVNGRDPVPSTHEAGIGIGNVRKRLDLLYPGKHKLLLNAEEELYYVNLTIEL